MVQDSGLGVRKRVVKLLKGIFVTTDSSSVKADICCRMIDLIQDHDDNVKVGFSPLFDMTKD